MRWFYHFCLFFAEMDLEIAKLGENKDLITQCRADVAHWQRALDHLYINF
jgi:hypothetical protein